MKKRVLSAVLWVYAIWYACNILGALIGVGLPGALLGLVAGAIVFAMPVLRQQQAAASSVTPRPVASADS